MNNYDGYLMVEHAAPMTQQELPDDRSTQQPGNYKCPVPPKKTRCSDLRKGPPAGSCPRVHDFESIELTNDSKTLEWTVPSDIDILPTNLEIFQSHEHVVITSIKLDGKELLDDDETLNGDWFAFARVSKLGDHDLQPIPWRRVKHEKTIKITVKPREAAKATAGFKLRASLVFYAWSVDE